MVRRDGAQHPGTAGLSGRSPEALDAVASRVTCAANRRDLGSSGALPDSGQITRLTD
jgi:hypothetical protein